MSKVIEKQNARKQHIKELLYEPFTKKGIEHVSTNEILKIVKVPNSTFFRLFKTKEELLKEMFNDVLIGILTVCNEFNGSNLKSFLFNDWDSAIQYAFSNPKKYLFWSYYQLHPLVDAFEHPMLKIHLNVYRMFYEEAVRSKTIDVPDLDYLNVSFNSNTGMAVRYIINSSDNYDPNKSHELFEKYWRSIEATNK